MNAVLQERGKKRLFSVTEAEGIRFSVITIDAKKKVAFRLTDCSIIVRSDAGDTIHSAVPAFTKDGICKLTVDDSPNDFELWQFSRLVLQKLFFGA